MYFLLSIISPRIKRLFDHFERIAMTLPKPFKCNLGILAVHGEH